MAFAAALPFLICLDFFLAFLKVQFLYVHFIRLLLVIIYGTLNYISFLIVDVKKEYPLTFIKAGAVYKLIYVRSWQALYVSN